MININLDYGGGFQKNVEAYITSFAATASEITMQKVDRQLANGNDNLMAGGGKLAVALADSIKKKLGKDEHKSGLNSATLKDSVKYIVGKSLVKKSGNRTSLDVEMKLEMENYGFALGAERFLFSPRQASLIEWMKSKSRRWGMTLFVPWGKNKDKKPETEDDFKKIANQMFLAAKRDYSQKVPSRIKDWFIPEQSDIDNNLGKFISGMNLVYAKTIKELNDGRK